VAWAVTFTDPAANLNVGTPLNVPLHPTQAHESIAGLVILVALLAFERRAATSAGPSGCSSCSTRSRASSSSSIAATIAALPECVDVAGHLPVLAPLSLFML
jgi:hypothetical protein